MIQIWLFTDGWNKNLIQKRTPYGIRFYFYPRHSATNHIIGNKIINDGDEKILTSNTFKNKLKSYVILVPNENAKTTISINKKNTNITAIDIKMVFNFPLSNDKVNLNAFIKNNTKSITHIISKNIFDGFFNKK